MTLDGPAGSGKGAAGQRLALALEWHFLDSGALYRACAFMLGRDRISQTEAAERLRDMRFETLPDIDSGDARVLLDRVDISSGIRTSAVGESASRLAADPVVRNCLLDVQRGMCRAPGLIADGRDMGTVVFPQADFKFYLTADLEVRAKRKHKQLKQMGNCVKLSTLYNKMEIRDRRDSTRLHAPLSIPAGATKFDTSNLTLNQVTDLLVKSVRSGLNYTLELT